MSDSSEVHGPFITSDTKISDASVIRGDAHVSCKLRIGALEAENALLRSTRDAVQKAGLEGLETLGEHHAVRVMIESIVEEKTAALLARVKELECQLQK